MRFLVVAVSWVVLSVMVVWCWARLESMIETQSLLITRLNGSLFMFLGFVHEHVWLNGSKLFKIVFIGYDKIKRVGIERGSHDD